jgi:hypothetical protein
MKPLHAEATAMNRSRPFPAPAAWLAFLLLPPLAACTAPAPGTARTTPPAGGDCVDPARVHSFAVLDDDVLLLDAGSDHYRVQLAPACIGVDSEFVLKMRGDPVTGRVCGFGRDAILTDRGDCRIDRVEWIPKDTYDALQHPVAPAK